MGGINPNPSSGEPPAPATIEAADLGNKIGWENRAAIGSGNLYGQPREYLAQEVDYQSRVQRYNEERRQQAVIQQQQIDSANKRQQVVQKYQGWEKDEAERMSSIDRPAFEMATEAENLGYKIDPYVYYKAREEGYAGDIRRKGGDVGSFADARQTVPIRSNESLPLTMRGNLAAESPTLEHAFVPYGKDQTQLNKVKMGYVDSGEVGYYEQDRYGRWQLISSGSRAALQGGGFSLNPLSPAVYTKESAGTVFSEHANIPEANRLHANPDLYSDLGAERYGGFVLPLIPGEAGKLRPKDQLSTYEDPSNFANLVSPWTVNLPKAQQVAMGTVPWGGSIGKETPTIFRMNAGVMEPAVIPSRMLDLIDGGFRESTAKKPFVSASVPFVAAVMPSQEISEMRTRAPQRAYIPPDEYSNVPENLIATMDTPEARTAEASMQLFAGGFLDNIVGGTIGLVSGGRIKFTPVADQNIRTGLGAPRSVGYSGRDVAVRDFERAYAAYNLDKRAEDLSATSISMESEADVLTREGLLYEQYIKPRTNTSGDVWTGTESDYYKLLPALTDYKSRIAAFSAKSKTAEPEFAAYASDVANIKMLYGRIGEAESRGLKTGEFVTSEGRVIPNPTLERPYGAWSDVGSILSNWMLSNRGETRGQWEAESVKRLSAPPVAPNPQYGMFGNFIAGEQQKSVNLGNMIFGAQKEFITNPSGIGMSLMAGVQLGALSVGFSGISAARAAASTAITPIGTQIAPSFARQAASTAIRYGIPAAFLGSFLWSATEGGTASPAKTQMNLGAGGAHLGAMVFGAALFPTAVEATNMRVGATVRNDMFIGAMRDIRSPEAIGVGLRRDVGVGFYISQARSGSILPLYDFRTSPARSPVDGGWYSPPGRPSLPPGGGGRGGGSPPYDPFGGAPTPRSPSPIFIDVPLGGKQIGATDLMPVIATGKTPLIGSGVAIPMIAAAGIISAAPSAGISILSRIATLPQPGWQDFVVMNPSSVKGLATEDMYNIAIARGQQRLDYMAGVGNTLAMDRAFGGTPSKYFNPTEYNYIKSGTYPRSVAAISSDVAEVHKFGGVEDYWTQVNIKANKPSHASSTNKMYITFKNLADFTPESALRFNRGLKGQNFEGRFKVPTDVTDAASRFENIVMYEQKPGDLKKGAFVAKSIWGGGIELNYGTDLPGRASSTQIEAVRMKHTIAMFKYEGFLPDLPKPPSPMRSGVAPAFMREALGLPAPENATRPLTPYYRDSPRGVAGKPLAPKGTPIENPIGIAYMRLWEKTQDMKKAGKLTPIRSVGKSPVLGGIISSTPTFAILGAMAPVKLLPASTWSIEESKVIQKYAASEDPFTAGYHPYKEIDIAFGELAREKGIRGVPQRVKTLQEFDAIKSGFPIIYRGVRGERRVQNFFDSEEAHGMPGVHGSALYGAYDLKPVRGKSGKLYTYRRSKTIWSGDEISPGWDVAKDYGDNIIAMKILPGANVVTDSKVYKMIDDTTQNYPRNIKDVITDAGRFGLISGIDAINVPSMGYMLILNKSKVAAIRLPKGSDKTVSRIIPLGSGTAPAQLTGVTRMYLLKAASPKSAWSGKYSKSGRANFSDVIQLPAPKRAMHKSAEAIAKIEWFESSIAKEPVEYASLHDYYTGDLEAVYTSNDAFTVAMTREQHAEAKKIGYKKAVVSTHLHPLETDSKYGSQLGSAFSANDLLFTEDKNLMENRVVSGGGKVTYRVKSQNDFMSIAAPNKRSYGAIYKGVKKDIASGKIQKVPGENSRDTIIRITNERLAAGKKGTKTTIVRPAYEFHTVIKGKENLAQKFYMQKYGTADVKPFDSKTVGEIEKIINWKTAMPNILRVAPSVTEKKMKSLEKARAAKKRYNTHTNLGLQFKGREEGITSAADVEHMNQIWEMSNEIEIGGRELYRIVDRRTGKTVAKGVGEIGSIPSEVAMIAMEKVPINAFDLAFMHTHNLSVEWNKPQFKPESTHPEALPLLLRTLAKTSYPSSGDLYTFGSGGLFNEEVVVAPYGFFTSTRIPKMKGNQLARYDGISESFAHEIGDARARGYLDSVDEMITDRGLDFQKGQITKTGVVNRQTILSYASGEERFYKPSREDDIVYARKSHEVISKPRSPIVKFEGITWDTSKSDFTEATYWYESKEPANQKEYIPVLHWMDPTEFRAKTYEIFGQRNLERDPTLSKEAALAKGKEAFNNFLWKENVQDLKQKMTSGENTFTALTIFYDRFGKPTEPQEGRHRVQAAIELGVTSMPVWEVFQQDINPNPKIIGEYEDWVQVSPTSIKLVKKYTREGGYFLQPAATKMLDRMPAYKPGQVPRMKIADINLEFQDMDFSPQGRKDVAEIMTAIQSGKKMPPILVSEAGYLQDGRHRLAAHKLLGVDEIDVVYGTHPAARKVVKKPGQTQMLKIVKSKSISTLKDFTELNRLYSPKEFEAIHTYTNPGASTGFDMNKIIYLRKNPNAKLNSLFSHEDSFRKVEPLIMPFESAFGKQVFPPLEKGEAVYRGLNLEKTIDYSSLEPDITPPIGSILKQRGFISTTISPVQALSYAQTWHGKPFGGSNSVLPILSVRPKEGTPIIYSKNQLEVILQNESTFVVTGLETMKFPELVSKLPKKQQNITRMDDSFQFFNDVYKNNDVLVIDAEYIAPKKGTTQMLKPRFTNPLLVSKEVPNWSDFVADKRLPTPASINWDVMSSKQKPADWNEMSQADKITWTKRKYAWQNKGEQKGFLDVYGDQMQMVTPNKIGITTLWVEGKPNIYKPADFVHITDAYLMKSGNVIERISGNQPRELKKLVANTLVHEVNVSNWEREGRRSDVARSARNMGENAIRTWEGNTYNELFVNRNQSGRLNAIGALFPNSVDFNTGKKVTHVQFVSSLEPGTGKETATGFEYRAMEAGNNIMELNPLGYKETVGFWKGQGFDFKDKTTMIKFINQARWAEPVESIIITNPRTMRVKKLAPYEGKKITLEEAEAFITKRYPEKYKRAGWQTKTHQMPTQYQKLELEYPEQKTKSKPYKEAHKPVVDLTEFLNRKPPVATRAERAMVVYQYKLTKEEIERAKLYGWSLNDILAAREADKKIAEYELEHDLDYDNRWAGVVMPPFRVRFQPDMETLQKHRIDLRRLGWQERMPAEFQTGVVGLTQRLKGREITIPKYDRAVDSRRKTYPLTFSIVKPIFDTIQKPKTKQITSPKERQDLLFGSWQLPEQIIFQTPVPRELTTVEPQTYRFPEPYVPRIPGIPPFGIPWFPGGGSSGGGGGGRHGKYPFREIIPLRWQLW